LRFGSQLEMRFGSVPSSKCVLGKSS
jgi:hypothetical protein